MLDSSLSPGGGVPSSLLTVNEAAEILAVSVSYLNKLRWGGGGPAYCKFGRSIRYRTDALMEWVQSTMTRNTSSEQGRR